MVVIYSRDSCAPCRTLKYFLKKKGVPFEEREPDASVTVIPTVEIDGQRLEGLNIPILSNLLESSNVQKLSA